MRRHLTVFIMMSILSLTGCASTDDLRRVHADLFRQIQSTNDKIASVERASVPLQQEVAGLHDEIAKDREALQLLRNNQAEGRAEMTDVREQIQQIRGTADGLRRDLAASSSKTGKREEEDKALRERLDHLTFRINFVENFLGIGKNEEPASAPAKEPAGAKAAKTDKESLYTAAYDLFKEAKYEKSREAFENFLKQYPDSEFSDNAQFWVGECYYFEKKYEKAILEYEKVTKNFPEGNKAPYALLKQGLSFLKLGDKASGKLLLQQVAKDYPNTSQARIARAKLLEIK